MENFPHAFIIASCDEVYRNNNVLFRLVKPAVNGVGVESTNRLVNVVPFRRVYQFKAKYEVDEFIHEILRRPLVLQPIMQFGRGVGSCGACYSEESWVVMVNQTHPKILSRLQMGLDVARVAFEKGHSAELKFHFGKAIQRLYQEHLFKMETEEAKGSIRTWLTFCRYSEWEHADLIVRFHGYSANSLKRQKSATHENVDMSWDFEDICAQEIMWSQIGNQTFHRPHLASLSEEEIHQMLPSWTINGVSPLLEIGESIPHTNYNYAKAGTLYESFRKGRKKQSAPPPEECHPTQNLLMTLPEEELGAVGGVEFEEPTNSDAIEHDFSQYDKVGKSKPAPSSSRRVYMKEEASHSSSYPDYDDYNSCVPSNFEYDDEQNFNSNSYRAEGNHYSKNHHRNATDVHRNSPVLNGHIDADVRIVTPSAVKGFEKPNNESFHHYDNSTRLKKQDSDRSVGSTNADSGFSEDGRRSRGDSYDYNEGINSNRFGYDKHLITKSLNSSLGGLDNPAFSHSEEKDPIAQHKQLISEALRQSKPHFYPGDQKTVFKKHDSPTVVNSEIIVAESFI